jgi:hypothetical protein
MNFCNVKIISHIIEKTCRISADYPALLFFSFTGRISSGAARRAGFSVISVDLWFWTSGEHCEREVSWSVAQATAILTGFLVEYSGGDDHLSLMCRSSFQREA